MATFLFKTEPSDYSWNDLLRDGRCVWSGVANPAALIHLRTVKAGDTVFIYHTGDEKRIVGTAKVVRGAYPEPGGASERSVVVDLEPDSALRRPVTLAEIKKDARFSSFPLVINSRLSVMPVSAAERQAIVTLSRRTV